MMGESPETRIYAYVEANRKKDAEVITRPVALIASFMRAAGLTGRNEYVL